MDKDPGWTYECCNENIHPYSTSGCFDDIDVDRQMCKNYISQQKACAEKAEGTGGGGGGGGGPGGVDGSCF